MRYTRPSISFSHIGMARLWDKPPSPEQYIHHMCPLYYLLGWSYNETTLSPIHHAICTCTDSRNQSLVPNLIKNNTSSDMVAIMQSHPCVPYLITPPLNRLFALFLSLCRNSTHLFHLPLHHDTSPLFLPGPGIHVRRHRPSSLLCSTYRRRISTRTSRFESRSYVIARSTRKPSRNDNNIASP